MNSTRISETSLSREDVLEFLSKIEGRNVIIIPHEIADHDAYAASVILYHLLKKHFSDKIDVNLFVPSISLEVKEFLEALKITFDESIGFLEKRISGDYSVILVDMMNPNRFTNPRSIEIINNAKRVLAIDHHKVETDRVYALYLQKSSTTEIVLEMANVLGLLDYLLGDTTLANLALAAILTDTSFLFYANKDTFGILTELVSRADYRRVYSTVKGVKKGISERMARLKGAKRAMIMKVDDKIIAITRVGSYEGSVASALISLGANISIVVSEKKEKGKKFFRVSARSNGFDISKIFLELSKKEGFEGGGHTTAAGLVIDAEKVRDINHLIKIIVVRLVNELAKK